MYCAHLPPGLPAPSVTAQHHVAVTTQVYPRPLPWQTLVINWSAELCRTVQPRSACRHRLSQLSVSQAADLAGALQARQAASAHDQIEAMVAERRQWVADLQRHQAAADQALGAVQVGLQGCSAWRSVLHSMGG